MTDNNAAAAVSMSRHLAAASVPSATCDRCGSRLVAWVTSTRTGKRYLADAIYGKNGGVIPSRHRPHFKTCEAS